MKVFLGTDITENKNNEEIYGEEFLKAKPSEMQTQSLEKAAENSVELVNKAKLPLPLRIAETLCGVIGFLGAAVIANLWGDSEEMTFSNLYQAFPWLFWVCGACIAVWGVLKLLSNKKAKETIESDEGKLTTSRLDSVINTIYAELGVPESAPETDILSFSYKMKNGEVHAKGTGWEFTEYNNPVYKVFTDGTNLCLANMDGRYDIPLEELTRIKTVRKSIVVPYWNKEESVRKGRYKQYKLSVDKQECVHVKPYHILEFTHCGEKWGIYFPCYELPLFEKLTALKAEE